MTIWFTSDLHFHHKRVIEYCNRPFASLEEMHEALITNWNKKVGKADTIYMLGDIFFCGRDKSIEILSQLNGKKKWIQGNHDKLGADKKQQLSFYVEFLPPLYEESINGQHIVMCHYPMHSWNRKHHRTWQLHGHVHSKDQQMNEGLLRYDVGVDANDFAPISFEQIRDYFGEQDGTEFSDRG